MDSFAGTFTSNSYGSAAATSRLSPKHTHMQIHITHRTFTGIKVHIMNHPLEHTSDCSLWASKFILLSNLLREMAEKLRGEGRPKFPEALTLTLKACRLSIMEARIKTTNHFLTAKPTVCRIEHSSVQSEGC